LEYEQKQTLQDKVYDVAPAGYWANATNHWNPVVPPIKSPIPGHNVNFQFYRTQDNTVPNNAGIGDSVARWAWIANTDPNTPQSMWDAYKGWNQNHGFTTAQDFDDWIKELLNK
jgi:hypothetical protein